MGMEMFFISLVLLDAKIHPSPEIAKISMLIQLNRFKMGLSKIYIIKDWLITNSVVVVNTDV